MGDPRQQRRELVERAYSRAGQNEVPGEYIDPGTGKTVRMRPSEWALAQHDRLRALPESKPESIVNDGVQDADEDDSEPLHTITPPRRSWISTLGIAAAGAAAGCVALLAFQQLGVLPPTISDPGGQTPVATAGETAVRPGSQQSNPLTVGEPAARPDPIAATTGVELPRLGPNFLEETVAFLAPPDNVTGILFVRASDVTGRLCLVAVSPGGKPEISQDGETLVPSIASCTILSLFPEDGLALALTARASPEIHFEGDEGFAMMTTVRLRWAPDGTITKEYQELTPVLQ